MRARVKSALCLLDRPSRGNGAGPRPPRLPAAPASLGRRLLPRRRSRQAAGCTARGCSPPSTPRASRRSSPLRRSAARDAASATHVGFFVVPLRGRRDRRRVQHRRNRPRALQERVPRLLRICAARGRRLHGRGPELVLRVAFRAPEAASRRGERAARQRALARARRAARASCARAFRARYVRIAGRWRDHVRMALLVEDWRARRAKRSRDERGALPGCVAARARRAAARRTHRRRRAEDRARLPASVRTRSTRNASLSSRAIASSTGSRATEPVDFNVHYHEGKAVVMPLVARKVARGRRRVSRVQIAQDYCLMWEAGAAGAVTPITVLSACRRRQDT